jgi:hypothetical protein
MTILDTIRGKPGAKPAQMQAPDVQRKLRAAEAELAELETQHGTAALDAIVGEAGASDRLEALNRNLARSRESVATLRAAHTAAVERDEETVRAQRTALHKAQLAAVRKHLDARDAAAEALSAAIAEATKQYHVLLERSAKAQAACPIGTTWPINSLCEHDPLRKALTHELFRLSATAGNHDGRAFPGAQLPGMEFQWQPAAIPALVDQVKHASRYVIAKLTGKSAE